MREIVRLSGADINSWTEATGSHRGRRPARIFLIKVCWLLLAVAGFDFTGCDVVNKGGWEAAQGAGGLEVSEGQEGWGGGLSGKRGWAFDSSSGSRRAACMFSIKVGPPVDFDRG